MRFNLALLLLVFMFLISVGASQEGSPSASTRVLRANRLKTIENEIAIRSFADGVRNTELYTEEHFSEFRRIVQEEAIETLSKQESAKALHESLKALLPAEPGIPNWPFVISADIQGVRTFFVGYDISYGPGGGSYRRDVIEAFAKAGQTYQAVSGAGQMLKNWGMQDLRKLTSLNKNEAWLFTYGKLFGYNQASYNIAILSFDGREFKELWRTPKTTEIRDYRIEGDTITVNYVRQYVDNSYRSHDQPMRDTIRLTLGGPVVVTTAVE